MADEGKLLAESLATVRTQLGQLKRCLVSTTQRIIISSGGDLRHALAQPNLASDHPTFLMMHHRSATAHSPTRQRMTPPHHVHTTTALTTIAITITITVTVIVIVTPIEHQPMPPDADQLMDALKSASTMLAELRSSSFSPKQYYELCQSHTPSIRPSRRPGHQSHSPFSWANPTDMAVFDALRHLSSYLHDAHVSGRHHLADLYELVQYAGNIVPRLYLMITVGTVYMSIPDAPVKEIMKDMMEMTRGVQHPTRGLFLRHYLSGLTRDHLPVGDDPGIGSALIRDGAPFPFRPGGNLQDSIGFVLTNFIEMNKLWVRLQHSGLSRDRERREMERRELRILVGTNLVRLSQLEGVDLEMYRRSILPSILEQVVNCKDVIAQEYLMEVVIQVFVDEFHLRTLSPFLSAVAQLHPKVAIKSIVIALIDRLAAYAAREAENESPEERQQQEEEAARRLLREVKRQREKAKSDADGGSPTAGSSGSALGETDAWGAEIAPPEQEEAPQDDGLIDGVVPTAPAHTVRKFRGIPENVRLFEVFWQQVVELIKVRLTTNGSARVVTANSVWHVITKARPDLSIQDIMALLVSLVNLSLSCYPDKLEYVDQVLSFARSKVQEYSDSPDLHHSVTIQNLLSLLLSPINSYLTVLTLLALPSYKELLMVQPYPTRRSIGHAIVASILKNETIIDSAEDVKGVLDLCHVLMRDQKDRVVPNPQGLGQRQSSGPLGGGGRGQQSYDVEEMAEEQGWIARMVHLFRANDLEAQFHLLQIARREFSEGGDRIRWTFPPLIVGAIKLVRRYKARERHVEDWDVKVSSLFKFMHQCTSVLYNKVESSEICLRLYLLALSAADEANLEELAYEFAVQAFTIYEESISESRAQLQAITLIIGTLQATRVFGTDNYDTLITKAALHGAKLLKKGQQATAVALASHLWWQTDTAVAKEVDADKAPFRDGKRVLECLQKSLRIATSSIDELTSVQLFCDALDQYLWYYERGVEAISPKHINSLVELITSNLDGLQSDEILSAAGGAASGLIEMPNSVEATIHHLHNILNYIARRKEDDSSPLFDQVEVAGPLLKVA
ncbi:BQ2448_7154 [Microbotryum intermedium]|uniref:BQ2448_7154 protein n=1 Tax=Microbotryum intermedium TaxID=269621 RepID=A0A238FKA7_9BASI|nr:BQ2448_7154 [Microbotryum intermedium]